MSEQDIQQLSILEQNLSSIVNQKQQYYKQLLEIDNALAAIKNKEEAYQIIGTIMIKKNSQELAKELEEKKRMFEIKHKTLAKQEEQVRAQAKKLQEQVVAALDENK